MTFPQIDKFDEGIENSLVFEPKQAAFSLDILFFIYSYHQSGSSTQHGIEPQLVVSTLQSQLSWEKCAKSFNIWQSS